MVIKETEDLLINLHGDALQSITVERIIIGVYFTGVKLSNGCGGISYTPTADLHGPCCSILAMGQKWGALKGSSVYDILAALPVSSLTAVVKLVVLNALSQSFISDMRYNIVYDRDVLDLVPIRSGEKIGMVGAFEPFIRRLKDMPDIDLSVIERKKDSLDNYEMNFYVPAENAKDVLPGCTTVIITGSSLANGTFEELLDHVNPGARLIVTGPTSSFLPDALFRRNVDIVGGIIVTDADLALDMLCEGAGAYQLFGVCVRKINILKELAGVN